MVLIKYSLELWWLQTGVEQLCSTTVIGYHLSNHMQGIVQNLRIYLPPPSPPLCITLLLFSLTLFHTLTDIHPRV